MSDERKRQSIQDCLLGEQKSLEEKLRQSRFWSGARGQAREFIIGAIGALAFSSSKEAAIATAATTGVLELLWKYATGAQERKLNEALYHHNLLFHTDSVAD